MRVLFLIFLLLIGEGAFAQKRKKLVKKKIIYKYREHEKFDFDNMDISGLDSSIGDLSITPRTQKNFKNKLPYKKNFNPEIRKTIESIH